MQKTLVAMFLGVLRMEKEEKLSEKLTVQS